MLDEPALTAWQPTQWAVASDWQPLVNQFLSSQAGQQLADFVTQRLAAGAVVYPPQPLRALELTALSQVKVVILGQDPYHGPGQAEGLAFSVAPGIRPPPSLRNIYKELAREAAVLRGAEAVNGLLPSNGSLVHWAQQGVLLLNTCLTVEQGQPASHANQGWEVLTQALVAAVAAQTQPVVFLLWGAHAQKFQNLVGQVVREHGPVRKAGQHRVLCANHPSPLSALRAPQPFIGCGHFGLANGFLQACGEVGIVW